MKNHYAIRSRSSQWNLCAIALSLVFLAAIGIQETGAEETKRAKQESTIRNPVPFTSNSDRPQWRLGFQGASYIYFLELKPDNQAICKERDVLVDERFNSQGQPQDVPAAISFPFSKATQLRGLHIVNPEKWTVIDMKGQAQEISFTQLTAHYNEVNSGCWYIGSESLREKNRLFYPVNDIDDRNLIIGIAGKMKKTPELRLPVTMVTEDPYFLPKGYQTILDLPEVKKSIGKRYPDFKGSITTITGTSMKATVTRERNEPDILWLVQWRGDRNPQASPENIWGIFRVVPGGFKPLYISMKSDEGEVYDKLYGARFIAAIDLDGDGLDEIIIKITQYEGAHYQVFTLKNAKYVEAYRSFYSGL